MVWLYKNWAIVSLLLALVLAEELLVANSHLGISEGSPIWWIALLIPIYLLHQFEEHFWPGGFKEFVNQRLFWILGADVPLDEKIVFWINLPLIWVIFPVFTLAGFYNIHLAAWIPVFSLFNGLLHLVVGVRWRCYNPGLATSIFLLLPVSGYATYILAVNGVSSIAYWLFTVFLAIIIHVAIVGIARGRAAAFRFNFP